MTTLVRRSALDTTIGRLAEGLGARFGLDGLALAVVTPETATQVERGCLSGDTRVALGSFGKPVLASVVRRLTSPEDRRRWAPLPAWPDVCVDHLLCHTSGLTESATGAGTITAIGPIARAGHHYSYFPAGFDVGVRWSLGALGIGSGEVSVLLDAELGMSSVTRRRAAGPFAGDHAAGGHVADDLVASVSDLRAFATHVAAQLEPGPNPSSELVAARCDGRALAPPARTGLLLEPVSATAELRAGSPWFWSQAGDLVLQHGGVTGDRAVMLLAVPDRPLVALVVVAGSAAAMAQIEAAEQLCRLLGVSLHPPTPLSNSDAQPAPPPRFAGRFHHADRVCEARAAGGSIGLRVDGGEVRHQVFLTADAFAGRDDDLRNPRYASSVVRDPSGDVVGLRLDERAYLAHEPPSRGARRG